VDILLLVVDGERGGWWSWSWLWSWPWWSALEEVVVVVVVVVGVVVVVAAVAYECGDASCTFVAVMCWYKAAW
jgi:hypothetical protein